MRAALSLDLLAQWKGLEADGQFRFTPPTHALLAFWQALEELEAEGGVAGRAARYGANQQMLARGMREMGFEAYLAAEDQSGIITAYRYPADPRFRLRGVLRAAERAGIRDLPGKLTQAECFRIGTDRVHLPGGRTGAHGGHTGGRWRKWVCGARPQSATCGAGHMNGNGTLMGGTGQGGDLRLGRHDRGLR